MSGHEDIYTSICVDLLGHFFIRDNLGLVWIAAAAGLTNFLVVGCYHMPHLDQREILGTKPIF
jgi:hypothetical protein